MKTSKIILYIIAGLILEVLLIDKFYKPIIENPQDVTFYDNNNIPLMRYQSVEVIVNNKDKLVLKNEDGVFFVIIPNNYRMVVENGKQ